MRRSKSDTCKLASAQGPEQTEGCRLLVHPVRLGTCPKPGLWDTCHRNCWHIAIAIAIGKTNAAGIETSFSSEIPR